MSKLEMAIRAIINGAFYTAILFGILALMKTYDDRTLTTILAFVFAAYSLANYSGRRSNYE